MRMFTLLFKRKKGPAYKLVVSANPIELMHDRSTTLVQQWRRLKTTLTARLRAEAAWARVYAAEMAILALVSLLCVASYRWPGYEIQGMATRKPAAATEKVAPLSRLGHDPVGAANWLVEAIVQVESAGNPRKVGMLGERGLMQIKPDTWRGTTRRLYGVALPFDQAFDPELNVRVGRAYLAELQKFLWANRDRWQSDERQLLLACYNVGPRRVAQARFDVRRLPAKVRDYVERATALHEMYLAERGPLVKALLEVSLAETGSGRS